MNHFRDYLYDAKAASFARPPRRGRLGLRAFEMGLAADVSVSCSCGMGIMLARQAELVSDLKTLLPGGRYGENWESEICRRELRTELA